MAKISEQINIGIIGSDSSHTLAFIQEFKKFKHCKVGWVDINNRTNLKFSQNRSKTIVEKLSHEEFLLIDDLILAPEVDAYCILTLDANTHLEILEIISQYNKPIFIDKPIFYKLEEFAYIDNLVFSSSALRYTDFVTKAKLKYEEKPSKLYVEGPLSFIDGIDGYFWYGIHLVEIIHTICGEDLFIKDVIQTPTYEVVTGICNLREFTIKGIKTGDPAFNISFGEYNFSSCDEGKNIYENLVNEIVDFFSHREAKANGKQVIESVIKINEMR